MESLLTGVALLFAVFIVLLAIPLSLSFSLTRHQQLQGYAQFKWLFGLVKFQTRFPGKTAPPADQTPPRKEKAKPDKTKKSARRALILFTQSAFRRHSMKFFRDLLRATHARDLYLRLRIGLGDPADTGMLWAIVGPLSGMMKNLQHTRIDIEPEFIDSVMDIESHGRFRLIPLQFVALTVLFLVSPVTIRAWRATRQAHE